MPLWQWNVRKLQWSTPVSHVAVERIRAELIVTLGGPRGVTSAPHIGIDIWLESEEHGELAFCRGHLVRHVEASVGKILWLGRTSSRSVHEAVKGCKTVTATGMKAAPAPDAKGKPQRPKLTVAEALFGLQAAMLRTFGATSLSLQAMDNGSQRLIQLYERLGFVRQEGPADSICWMDAAVDVISELAPLGWMEDLVPKGFDAQAWLASVTRELWLERVERGKLPLLRLPLPRGANVAVQLSKCLHPGAAARLNGRCGCLVAEAVLNTGERDSAYAACLLRLQQRVLTVRWLGRSGKKAASFAVKGKAVYPVSPSQRPADADAAPEPGDEDRVTGPVALLGSLAAMACWFGVDTVKVDGASYDKGSGKLLEYLRGLGFQDVPAADGEPRLMSVACEALAQRSCPTAWRARLLYAEATSSTERLGEIGELSCGIGQEARPAQAQAPQAPVPAAAPKPLPALAKPAPARAASAVGRAKPASEDLQQRLQQPKAAKLVPVAPAEQSAAAPSSPGPSGDVAAAGAVSVPRQPQPASLAEACAPTSKPRQRQRPSALGAAAAAPVMAAPPVEETAGEAAATQRPTPRRTKLQPLADDPKDKLLSSSTSAPSLSTSDRPRTHQRLEPASRPLEPIRPTSVLSPDTRASQPSLAECRGASHQTPFWSEPEGAASGRPAARRVSKMEKLESSPETILERRPGACEVPASGFAATCSAGWAGGRVSRTETLQPPPDALERRASRPTTPARMEAEMGRTWAPQDRQLDAGGRTQRLSWMEKLDSPRLSWAGDRLPQPGQLGKAGGSKLKAAGGPAAADPLQSFLTRLRESADNWCAI